TLDREGTVVVIRFRQDARVDPGALARLLQARGDLTLVPPAVLRIDLAKPVDAPRQTRAPVPAATGGPGASSRVVTRGGQTSRLVVPSKRVDTPDDDDSTESSWWTARATSGVAAGFTREAILAEQPPDPAAPDGLFERLRSVLVALQGL